MKKMRSRKSFRRVGVFTAWFYGHYQLELISGIEEAAGRHNVQVVYFSGRALHSPVPYENDHNIIYDTALNASLDGLIIMSLLANYCDDYALTEFIARYKDIPIITVNFRSLIGNAILTNNKKGFSALMNHLIDQHGYRKLAFVKGPEHNRDAMERYTVYKSALSGNGIDYNPALVTGTCYTFRAGQEAVNVYLDERRLRPGRDIEAVVCANDAIALGVIDALYERGLRVPRDVAVTGFDNMNASIFPKFPLTSVKQHLREIGNMAMCNLLDYQPHREPIFFDTELVIRDSCGCIKPEEKSSSLPDINRERASSCGMDSDVYKKDLEFIYYEITRIIDNLKDLQKMTEFSAWMQGNFPDLGIESAWILLFTEVNSDVRTYRLLAGFDQRQPEGTELKDTVAETVIFDHILTWRPGRSYCMLPLLSKGEKYGLLVMEVNLYTSLVFDTLSSHIGSSIRNMLLGEEVIAMNRQLIQADEQKTRFFINVAHETKTPLTLIRNYLALYMEEHEPDEKLVIMKQHIDLLLANMLNFLDAERLQKEELIYRHDELVNVSAYARGKSDLFRAVASRKNIRITLTADDRVVIRIDPLALERIFNNLLDNAVRYIQSGGRIHLNVRKTNGKAILRISDNGPGLPADRWGHLFEPYYLLSKKRDGRQGIGVGLSIVKKIVDGLGASIKAEKGRRGGTSFTITFTDESGAAEPEQLQEILTAASPIGPVQDVNIKEGRISADRSSLFVIDDNIHLLKFIQTAFSESYNVFMARSTEEALLRLKVIPRPDVIISDVMMDGEDGFQLLYAISEKDGYNDIPFIFLTALGGETAKLKGLDLGAVDYIEKPFSIATLRAKIESIIGLRGRQVKQDRERIRYSIDGLLSGSGTDAAEPVKSGFELHCEKFGIVGREKEIIRMIMGGLVNKEIASCMHVSQRTVEYHITKIYKKCGVNNKYNLLKKFRE
ncbi:MAG: substrate-binding domain-containing protein [Spirochaetales bacterium]|nr:substrate-binding domain-containing protein [Spirochaetales bacterium]